MNKLKSLEKGKIYYLRVDNRTYIFELLFRLKSPRIPLTEKSNRKFATFTTLGEKPAYYRPEYVQRMKIILERIKKDEITIEEVHIKDLPLYIYLETTPEFTKLLKGDLL